MPTLRRAFPEDHPVYARLFRELEVPDPVPPLDVWWARQGPQTIVAEVRREVVGYLWYELLGGVLYVRNVVSDPAVRRQGIGRKLLREAMRRGVESGATRWCLNVKDDNVAAIRLYESLGLRTEYPTRVLRVRWDVPLPQPGDEGPALTVTDRVEGAAEVERTLGLLEGSLQRGVDQGRLVRIAWAPRTPPGRVSGRSSAEARPEASAAVAGVLAGSILPEPGRPDAAEARNILPISARPAGPDHGNILPSEAPAPAPKTGNILPGAHASTPTTGNILPAGARPAGPDSGNILPVSCPAAAAEPRNILQVVGLASFDPAFPGAFPFSAADLRTAAALLAALEPHRQTFSDGSWREHSLQLVIERNEALADAMVERGAEPVFRILHLSGPLRG